MATIGKCKTEGSTSQATNHTFSGTTLLSWSREQKLAMIAGFGLLGVLLAASACSKQAPKPALVGVSGPSPKAIVTVPPTTNAAVATNTAELVPAAKPLKRRPANVTYRDANSGVSFVYPRKATLFTSNNGTAELAAVGDVPMNFVQPGGSAVATVALPGNSYPGTDFASAFFNVNVNRSLAEPDCAHFAFVDTRNADGEPVDAEKVKVGPAEMETTSTFSASAARQVETQYYHSYDNGVCYEYVLGLGTEGFSTEGGIEHVNRDEVFAKLEKILATVKVELNKSVDDVAPSKQGSAAEPKVDGTLGGKE